ncbi:MAG TPA: hypothetical protein VLE22_13015 [Bryobacteraceae bacterium]|nr:hypothetical protein [Bryobacteraceae bacterium]
MAKLTEYTYRPSKITASTAPIAILILSLLLSQDFRFGFLAHCAQAAFAEKSYKEWGSAPKRAGAVRKEIVLPV